MEKATKNHHRSGNKCIYKTLNDHCPIYVHEFEKYNWKNNLISKEPAKKSKSVLNKIEETYWANWKPSKTKSISTIKEILLRNGGHQPDSQTKLQDHGDCANTKSKIELDGTVDDKSKKNSNETQNEEQNNNIQGDSSSFVENKDTENKIMQASSQTDPIELKKPEDQNKSEEVIVIQQEDNSDDEKEEETNIETIKHTDSLILAKKRQKIVKEYFQQPKCIRLYKKLNLLNSKSFFVKTTAGTTSSLKPILKMESSIKETFHMGPPGSSILMTTSSYVRKSTKKLF